MAHSHEHEMEDLTGPRLFIRGAWGQGETWGQIRDVSKEVVTEQVIVASEFGLPFELP